MIESLFCTALGLLVVMVVLLVVLPVVVLVPLIAVGLLVAGVVIVVAGVAALAFSPLLLSIGLVWLIWRLVRGPKRSARATIPG